MLDDLITTYVNRSTTILRKLPHRRTGTEEKILENNRKFIRTIWRHK